MAFYQRLPFYQALMDEAGYGAEARACGAALARGDQQAASRVSDEMVDELYLAGTPAQIKASMDEYFDQGAELLILSTRAASDRIPDAFREHLRRPRARGVSGRIPPRHSSKTAPLDES